jgi:hypothetical protein
MSLLNRHRISVQTKGLEVIKTVSGTGASGTLSFNPITGVYRQLWLVLYGRSDTAATSATVKIQLNGNSTGASYIYQLTRSSATVVSGVEAIGTQGWIHGGVVPGATSTANYYSQSQIWIDEYANTSNFKIVNVDAAGITNGASSGIIKDNVSGQFGSTAAVTQIDLVLTAGNWTTGSRATLWGMAA